MGFKHGKMAQNTKASGKMIRQTERGKLLMRMGTLIREIGKTTKPMELVYSLVKMGLAIRGSGEMIYKTAKGLRPGQIRPSSMEISLMERKLEKGN